MQDNEIRATFSRVYNNKPNFMTPYAIKFGKRGKMIWELSTGDEKSRRALGKMYGVTVIELPKTKRHDLSQCFSSMEAAESYIKKDFTHA